MKYKYYVVFSTDGLGIGNAEIIRNTKITTFKDVQEMANLLKEDTNRKKERKIEYVVIINFMLLEEIEDEEGVLSQE